MTIGNLQNLILRNGLKTLFALTILLAFLYILSPFFIPVILGGILAMAFSPYISYFMRKGFSRNQSMQILTLIILLLGIIPTAFFLIRGSHVIMDAANDPESIFSSEFLELRSKEIITMVSSSTGLSAETMSAQLEKLSVRGNKIIFKMFGEIVSEIPNIALISIITILSTYFFLGKEEKVRALFDQYFFFSSHNGQRFIKMMKSSCKEVFFSNFLTGIVQSLVVSIGALVAGVGDFFLVFFTTFIFSFVPIIGAAPVAFALALYAFITRDVSAGIILSFVGMFAGLSDNLIRPFLSSRGNVEVPPFIGFMAVIGGVTILGLPGLFVAPLTATITFGMIPILFDEYMEQK
jgi:predicted PurR-regulated permease PerM